MPPKCKFTKEEIVSAALDITRGSGLNSVTARAVGARLGASPKVIFAPFKSMDELQAEVIAAANEVYQNYIKEDMEKGEFPPYKASGMAYIRFAVEEKELFKLLFMRDRRGEEIQEDFGEISDVIDVLCQNTGMSREEANYFHLKMWVTVHGIAAMAATNYLKWDKELASRLLTDVYDNARGGRK